MNLHENKKLFTDAVLAAAEQLDIKAVYIEKDYWITRSLKLMAQDSNAERAIFKGCSYFRCKFLKRQSVKDAY